MTTETRTLARPRVRAEAASLVAAALLGVALIWVAGFAEATAVHDFAHDQRHAISFPCH